RSASSEAQGPPGSGLPSLSKSARFRVAPSALARAWSAANWLFCAALQDGGRFAAGAAFAARRFGAALALEVRRAAGLALGFFVVMHPSLAPAAGAGRSTLARSGCKSTPKQREESHARAWTAGVAPVSAIAQARSAV